MASFGNRDSEKHVPTEKKSEVCWLVGVLAWLADINDTPPAGLINNFFFCEKSLLRASVNVYFIKLTNN